jgi:anti-sigma factor RsiW
MVTRDNAASKACKNLEEDLVLYYYGELSEAARGDVETHLKGCDSCRAGLSTMSKLMPMTVTPDEPPQSFWDNYSRETRHKLAAVTERKPWWQRFAALFQLLPMPALATGAVVLLALTLTLGRGLWQSSAPSSDDAAFMEVLPIAENLEFFSNMEVLDNMDLLETLGGPGNGTA